MEAVKCAAVVPVAPVSSTAASRSRVRFAAAGSRRYAGPVALRSVCRAQAASFQNEPEKDASVSKRDVTNKAVATEAPPMSELVGNCINSIRFLAIDAVEKANSGHPGLPMGCAPMSYVLFKEFMAFNPKNPGWFNRDRFVLSAGHGCMLQYALLHLTGYDSVSLDDIKQFRQIGSCTPGHPENFETAGIEVTTGPLGQGISQAVGLAVAEKHLAARFNKPDCTVVDHYTYVIMGDGCCQEGVANEAASLAGHWGLGKLIALYDDNKISIDGSTDISFTEDVLKRHEAMGWHVIHVKDGNHDLDAIKKAIEEAKAVTDKPTMIKVSTLIGYGSPNKANSYLVHGAALGTDEVAATRENLKWTYEPFEVPQEVYDHMSGVSKGAEAEAAWDKTMSEYAEKYPEDAEEFKALISGELPSGWEESLPTAKSDTGGNATRIHSQTMLNSLAPVLPGLLGGSADLAPSNMTLMKMFGDFQKDTPAERNVRFGVREFGMGCVGIGLSLHKSGLIPYVATFFIFTDYMRASMRLAALSQAGVIFVTTHDSIGLGEDGPTHQPVEHLASFRAMPGILTMRPGDLTETAGAYKIAVERRNAPTLLVFSRQKMPNSDGTSIEGVAKGGYTVSDNTAEGGVPDCILLGTGTELCMCEEAAGKLREEGKSVRVVSMVCTELFDEQSAEYKESVLPAACKARVSIEAASTYGWERYVGSEGKTIGVDSFGASGPGPDLYEKYGLSADAVVAAAKSF